MSTAVMYPDKDTGFRYFLLLVDIFSTKVFTKPLKSREVKDIIQALKQIIQEFKSEIHVIQADRESSFMSAKFQQFLNQQKILFRDNAKKLCSRTPEWPEMQSTSYSQIEN